jgi:hypothetical protein
MDAPVRHDTGSEPALTSSYARVTPPDPHRVVFSLPPLITLGLSTQPFMMGRDNPAVCLIPCRGFASTHKVYRKEACGLRGIDNIRR